MSRSATAPFTVCLVVCLLLFASHLLAASSPRTESDEFQSRIEQAARALETDPRLKGSSPEQIRNTTEFVAGNMLFVLLHELGHALIADMELPVLGREEDAADAFATIMLLKVGTAFSHQLLVEAAKGWFLSDAREKARQEPVVYYDDHELDGERAYQIVCMMVGSDRQEFKDLADETHLPEERQTSCRKDYINARWSWDTVLKPHRRAADQPKMPIDVRYGEGKGWLGVYEHSFRPIHMLEAVAAHASDQFVWRDRLGLVMQSCGEDYSHSDVTRHEIVLCYETAADFTELCREYGKSSQTPILIELPVRSHQRRFGR